MELPEAFCLGTISFSVLLSGLSLLTEERFMSPLRVFLWVSTWRKGEEKRNYVEPE